MARNLFKAGHEVRGSDLNEAAVAAFVADGGQRAATMLEAAEGADLVVTMLPNDAVVSSIYLGSDGLIERLKSRPMLVDCSTIGPETARNVASSAAARGFAMLDAPVSGGPQAAQAATLSFMVGGTEQDFARIEPVLKEMGRTILHVGANGAGQVAKLCNNMTAAVVMAATAEALALGVAQGIDPAVLSQVMASSSGGSFLLSRWNPWPGVLPEAPSSRGYADGFQLGLMLKDVTLAVESARRLNAPTPFGSLAHSLYAMKARSAAEAPRRDFSSILELFTRP